MKEVLVAVWPFVVMAVCMILSAMRANRDVKLYGSASKYNFMIEGMAVGFIAGMGISLLTDFNTGIGTCMGMLAGLMVGAYIPKKVKEEETEEA